MVLHKVDYTPARKRGSRNRALRTLVDRTHELAAVIESLEPGGGPASQPTNGSNHAGKSRLGAWIEHSIAERLLPSDRSAACRHVALTIAAGLFAARHVPVSNGAIENAGDVIGRLQGLPQGSEWLAAMIASLAVDARSGADEGHSIFVELGAAVRAVDEVLAKSDFEHEITNLRQAGSFGDLLTAFYDAVAAQFFADEKRGRGIFCTPQPVAEHLVASAHEALSSTGVAPGIADSSLHVLDPAAGTGVFLCEVVRAVRRAMESRLEIHAPTRREKWWQEYVRSCLLPRLHGFELLLPAYAFAHWNVAWTLMQTGFDWTANDSLDIRLTNALDLPGEADAEEVLNGDAARMVSGSARHERMQADETKRLPMAIVLGNPPYAGRSANLSAEHRKWIDRYRRSHVAVRNPLQREKNLNDDYVKFLAFAEEQAARCAAENPGERPSPAVVAMVTNHSYLDGEYHTGLRASLCETYDTLWCLDLHGNSDKRETPPAGGRDENVFSISTGVALLVGVRGAARDNANAAMASEVMPTPAPPRPSLAALGPGRATQSTLASQATLYCGDLWGAREEKLRTLQLQTIARLADRCGEQSGETRFKATQPASEEFFGYRSLAEWLPEYSAATETGFDALMVAFEREELIERVRAFCEDARHPLRLRAIEGNGLAAALAREPEKLDAVRPKLYVRRLQFKPFDYRWAWLKADCLKTHAFANMQRLSATRPGLATTARSQGTFAAMAVGGFFAHKLLQAYDRSLVMPCDALSSETYHLLLALLSSRTFGERYADSLRSSPPRLPEGLKKSLAAELVKLGADVAAWQLMDRDYPHASWNESERVRDAAKFADLPRWDVSGEARCVARERRYDAATRVLTIGDSAAIRPVEPAAVAYRVGSYKVLEHWLRAREGRILSADERSHVSRVVVAVTELSRLQDRIDACIRGHGGWPRAFA